MNTLIPINNNNKDYFQNNNKNVNDMEPFCRNIYYYYLYRYAFAPNTQVTYYNKI